MTLIYYLKRNLLIINQEKLSSKYRGNSPRVRALLGINRPYLTY
jgi:hypothetical protein